MTDSRPVAARGLVKRYGDLVAVDHVDLTVEKGDVFGYLVGSRPITVAVLLVTPILIFWIAYRQRQRVLASTET